MKKLIPVLAAVLAVAGSSMAQVASHAPTVVTNASASTTAPQPSAPPQVNDNPVAKVNGVVLTNRDLVREMYAIFPYAKQHNGFPKAQEAAIRQGALEMIIFEELVFQEAGRRKLTISAERMSRAEAEFRKQFHSPDEYEQYLQAEMHGSRQVLRQQMQRSLLIEQVLKTEVEDKVAVTPAEVKAYYDKNPARFQTPESFSIQSISILPPRNAKEEIVKEGRKRAEEALRQARATKSYQEFGLLAEKLSEDDFRVNMGDHKAVGRDKLPPQVVTPALAMQTGQVSDIVQIENAFTIFRLNVHSPAGKQNFAEVQVDLQTELQKSKYEQLRSNLARRLRAKAKIELV